MDIPLLRYVQGSPGDPASPPNPQLTRDGVGSHTSAPALETAKASPEPGPAPSLKPWAPVQLRRTALWSSSRLISPAVSGTGSLPGQPWLGCDSVSPACPHPGLHFQDGVGTCKALAGLGTSPLLLSPTGQRSCRPPGSRWEEDQSQVAQGMTTDGRQGPLREWSLCQAEEPIPAGGNSRDPMEAMSGTRGVERPRDLRA